MDTEVIQEDEIWDLLSSDLPEEEILAQLASHPDQEAVANVTGSILSLLVPTQSKPSVKE